MEQEMKYHIELSRLLEQRATIEIDAIDQGNAEEIAEALPEDEEQMEAVLWTTQDGIAGEPWIESVSRRPNEDD